MSNFAFELSPVLCQLSRIIEVQCAFASHRIGRSLGPLGEFELENSQSTQPPLPISPIPRIATDPWSQFTSIPPSISESPKTRKSCWAQWAAQWVVYLASRFKCEWAWPKQPAMAAVASVDPTKIPLLDLRRRPHASRVFNYRAYAALPPQTNGKQNTKITNILH